MGDGEHTSPDLKKPKKQTFMAAQIIKVSGEVGGAFTTSQTRRRIAGVIGRRAFCGRIEVAFLIPFSMSSRRGRLPSGNGVFGPLVMWRCRTAARYVLIVCHLRPFNARYAENSSNCCSDAGRGWRPVSWQKVRYCFWPERYVWAVDFATPSLM